MSPPGTPSLPTWLGAPTQSKLFLLFFHAEALSFTDWLYFPMYYQILLCFARPLLEKTSPPTSTCLRLWRRPFCVLSSYWQVIEMRWIEWREETVRRNTRRNIVSWTSMLTGYVQDDYAREVLLHFKEFLNKESDSEKNEIAFIWFGCCGFCFVSFFLCYLNERDERVLGFVTKRRFDSDVGCWLYFDGCLCEMRLCGCLWESY